MDISGLLDTELVLVDLDVADREEAIRRLAALLDAGGYVEEGFADAALEREKVFPTGLPTEGIQIALPHTEAEYVRTSRLAIGVLRRPVKFQMMGDPDSTVDAAAVFLLAIAEQEAQVTALQQLAELFQDGVTLNRIASATSAEEVYAAMREGAGVS